MGRKGIVVEDLPANDAGDLLSAPVWQEADALAPLLRERSARLPVDPLPCVVIGTLVGIADTGRAPLILFPGQPGHVALRARSVVDLHGVHVGKEVVLSFQNGDATLPIVMGVLHNELNRALPVAGQVEIEHDGERMVVAAREQLVLRCGEASITLTSAGKVLIEGSYVSSRSRGVNRIKGGSIQLN